jgi:hypothetical protein
MAAGARVSAVRKKIRERMKKWSARVLRRQRRGFLYASEGGGVDLGTLQQGDGISINTQELLRLEEDDDGVEIGRATARLRLAACASDREERRRTWAGFGPGEKERRKGTLFFIQKSFLFLFSKSILLFWKQYENSNFSGIFQSNHGPSLHIEAPWIFLQTI